GSSFSTDLLFWNCAGSLSAVLIRLQKLTKFDTALLVWRNVEVGGICLLEYYGVFARFDPAGTLAEHDRASPARQAMLILTHAALPVVLALAFRKSVKEFLRWWEVHLVVSEQEPSEWHLGVHDDYAECTIVQMDITGFTALSSDLRADELLDLVNAIFTSIDKAAELIGSPVFTSTDKAAELIC
ncbi:hypothetical protein T484DRAFT_1763605, partial [Baffinella frigidus]